MMMVMGRLHDNGIPGLKPDAFTYTAVIDAWYVYYYIPKIDLIPSSKPSSMINKVSTFRLLYLKGLNLVFRVQPYVRMNFSGKWKQVI